jgi:hypothetical protein
LPDKVGTSFSVVVVVVIVLRMNDDLLSTMLACMDGLPASQFCHIGGNHSSSLSTSPAKIQDYCRDASTKEQNCTSYSEIQVAALTITRMTYSMLHRNDFG